MRDTATLGEDWVSPWTGQTAKKGSQITLVSVIQLRKNKLLTIAVPNATALCLNVSRRCWEESRVIRKESGIDRSLKDQVSFANHSAAFDYIERVMESVVMAFTALEAFINELIPDDFEYHTHRRSEIILEVMHKDQVERRLSLDEKLTDVLPEILSVQSPKGKRCWTGYRNLKKVRDRIVHMKSEDRRSSGPDVPTLWHDVFKIEPPHKQAIELIEFFVGSGGRRPRWHKEYHNAT